MHINIAFRVCTWAEQFGCAHWQSIDLCCRGYSKKCHSKREGLLIRTSLDQLTQLNSTGSPDEEQAWLT